MKKHPIFQSPSNSPLLKAFLIMKIIGFKVVLLLQLFFVFNLVAQEQNPSLYTAHNKGKFTFSWGANRASYSKSDITFTGKDYNFTLYDVSAHDRPKGWHIDYINPTRLTIPQTNFKIGYFISDHYKISLALDHMKYIMTTDQFANISGSINLEDSESGSLYNGDYRNVPIQLSKDFLEFEHTNGLNYIQTKIARYDDISSLFNIQKTDKLQVNILEGLGAGILYPKTNTTLLQKPRTDEFHLSGYGITLSAGLNITIFKHFFVQGDLAGGFINMNDIKTTHEPTDRASQKFFYLQRIIRLGGIFKIF